MGYGLQSMEWNTTDEAIAEATNKAVCTPISQADHVEIWDMELFQSCLITAYSQYGGGVWGM